MDKSIEYLSRGQRSKLRERLAGKENIDDVIALIERSQEDNPARPSRVGTRPYRWGKVGGLQRYRCRQCGCAFDALTGAPLARLRKKEKWIGYEQALIQGLSLRNSASTCAIAKNTSFEWRHRFLQMPAAQHLSKMNGIIEADDTYFLESFKGQRQLPRPARKRGGKASKRGASAERMPVLAVRGRHGETAKRILDGASAEQIGQALIPLLNKDIVLRADGMPAHKQIARDEKIVHRPVNMAAGRRVIDNIHHIQNVNAHDSRLKQWMKKFHGVATRYLGNYLEWHGMIDRLSQGIARTHCFLSSLGKTRQFQQLTAT